MDQSKEQAVLLHTSTGVLTITAHCMKTLPVLSVLHAVAGDAHLHSEQVCGRHHAVAAKGARRLRAQLAHIPYIALLQRGFRAFSGGLKP